MYVQRNNTETDMSDVGSIKAVYTVETNHTPLQHNGLLTLFLLMLMLLLLLKQEESCLLQQLGAEDRQFSKRGVKANRLAAHVPIHLVVVYLWQLLLLLLLLQ